MSTFRRCCAAIALMLALGGLAAGCGRTREGGETGSETHWLASCETTADCRVGQCLCGICTEPCRVALDCPAPLDVCSEPLVASMDDCQTAICTSSEPGEIEASLEGVQRIDACYAGRPTALVLLPNRSGAMSAFQNANLGFFTADFVGRLRRVSLDGRLAGEQELPFERVPNISQFVSLPDGSALLAGNVADFDGYHGWVGKVDPSWGAPWERQLDTAPDATDLVALPDGGAVVVSFRQVEQGDPVVSSSLDVVWNRISATGDVLWQQQETLPAPASSLGRATRAVALTDAMELRIAVTTADGGRVIFGSLDGEKEVRALDVDLTTFAHVLAVPGGGFALVSKDSHVAMLDASGNLIWQREYANKTGEFEQNFTDSAAFSSARQELVLVGRNAQLGSWLQALDLAGNPTWQLTLQVQAGNIKNGGRIERFSPGHGPALYDVAAGPDGSLLATGVPGDFAYLWVGGGSCD